MSEKPREYTPEEVRDMLLDHVWSTLEYWDREAPNKREAMEGLAFSILTMLDGCASLPGFLVTPAPHEDDKEFLRESGENWFPENLPDLGMLHDYFYAAKKRAEGDEK